MSKRILITGAQGFLGRYVIDSLSKAFPYWEVLGVGRSPRRDDHFTHTIHIKDKQIIQAPLPVSFSKDIYKRYKYLSVDINNKAEVDEVINLFKPSIIIHLASGLKGDPCGKLLNTNIVGTLNLLSACRSYIKDVSFIAVSSGGVYGFPHKVEDLPFKESYPCNPQEAYQFAKATEEAIVREFCKQFSIPCMVLRVFNVVGSGQDERHVCGFFVSELISIRRGYKQHYLETSILTSTRDFVDVRDVANNIVKLLASSQFDQTFNISSSTPVLIRDILDYCMNLVFDGQKDVVKINNTIESPSHKSVIDQHFGCNKKLIQAGGTIDFTISSSIIDMVSYYNSIYDKQLIV